MNLVQFAFRANSKLRQHIRHYIYLPSCWEVETVILAEIMGMPKPEVETELAWHRSCWDLKSRIAEMRCLAEFCSVWQTWIDAKEIVDKRLIALNSLMDLSSASVLNIRMAEHIRRRTTAPLRDLNIKVLPNGRILSKDPKMKRSPHPLMDVIDKYRLGDRVRNPILRTMIFDASDRWYAKYEIYKKQCKVFREEWQKWRIEIAALGPDNRNAWPMQPAIPVFPTELAHVDQEWLHTQVRSALRHKEAGQLLFLQAKD
jgi:hypothetical protein